MQMFFKIACSQIEQLKKIEKFDENSVGLLDISLRQLELHLQTMLKHLIKLSMNKQCDASVIDSYKRVYSSTLQTPPTVKENSLLFAKHLRNVLEEIEKSIHLIK